MKISVKVKTKAAQSSVQKLNNGSYAVSVREIPEKGKANRELIRLLAQYFQVPQNQVDIAKGAGGKQKIVQIIQ